MHICVPLTIIRRRRLAGALRRSYPANLLMDPRRRQANGKAFSQGWRCRTRAATVGGADHDVAGAGCRRCSGDDAGGRVPRSPGWQHGGATAPEIIARGAPRAGGSQGTGDDCGTRNHVRSCKAGDSISAIWAFVKPKTRIPFGKGIVCDLEL